MTSNILQFLFAQTESEEDKNCTSNECVYPATQQTKLVFFITYSLNLLFFFYLLLMYYCEKVREQKQLEKIEEALMGRGGESKGTISVQGSSNAIVQDLDLTWQGSKCSFYHTVTARQQMNASDTYWVLAFYQTKS